MTTDPTDLRRTRAYFLSFAAFGLASASLGPTVPALAAQTGSNLDLISSLFVGRSLGYLAGIQFSSRLFDRVPGHPLMAIGIGLMAMVLTAVPLLPSLAALVVAMITLGIAEGTIEVGGNTMLVRNHPDNLAPFMNGLHFFFGAGAFVAPLVVGQAIGITGGIAWAYWTLAIFTLPAALSILSLKSPTTVATDAMSTNEPPECPVSWPAVILVAACLFTVVGAEVGFAGWIYTYAYEMNLANETTAAYLTSVFWGAFAFGRLAAIPVSKRVEPQVILLADIVGAILSVGIVVVFPGSVWVLWVATLGAGLSIASMFASLLNLAQSRLQWSARISGWFFMGSSLGGMSVPWIIGQLFETWGSRATMLVLLADIGVSAVLFWLLWRFLTRSRILDENVSSRELGPNG